VVLLSEELPSEVLPSVRSLPVALTSAESLSEALPSAMPRWSTSARTLQP
jgi:hypothetical protein